MITVEKYIRKLLFEHDCVIIPEFGGLLTHHIGAHYDAVNSVFLPARKRLAFNEVLKIDDGLLNYYIATHEKLSRDEAANLVRGYVDSLRQQLLEGGPLTMDSIGVFSTNTEGKLVFEPDYSQNFNGDWYGFQELSVRQVERGVSTDVVELNVFDSEVELISTNDTHQGNARSRSWINWAAAAIFIGAVTLMSALSSRSDSSSLLSTLNPLETVGDFSFETKDPASNPMPPKPVVTRIIKTIPAETVIKETPKPKTAPIEEVVFIPKREQNFKKDQKAIDKAFKETAPKSTIAAEPKTVNNKKVTNQYFLIAGSFGRIKNAQDLQGQLISKGFSETSILDNGHGRWIKVSAGSYASMEKAMQNKKKVDAATGADSWVFHQR